MSRDPLDTNDLAFLLQEFLNAQFLKDANALYFGGRELQGRASQLLRVIETVGEIDAAIAVASFRVGADGWMRPRFALPDGKVIFSDLRHPLVDQAVPNSIGLAPPHGVLVTGSNMSGKSTFLRTVGSTSSWPKRSTRVWPAPTKLPSIKCAATLDVRMT